MNRTDRQPGTTPLPTSIPADLPYSATDLARLHLSGPEGLEFLSWRAIARSPRPEAFQAVLNTAVYDEMIINRARHTALAVEHSLTSPRVAESGTTFLFVIDGQLTLEVDGETTVLDSGTGCTIPGTLSYKAMNAAPVSTLQVIVAPGSLSLRGFPLWDGGIERLTTSPLLTATVGFLNSLAAELPASGTVAAFAAQRAVHDLFAGLLLESRTSVSGPVERGSATVGRAIAFIADHYGDPHLTTADIAAGIHISVRQVQRLFEDTGTSVSEHLRMHRLRMASALLSDPNSAGMSATEISEITGFGEPNRMRRAFRAAYGMTPGEYRKSVQG